MRTSSANFWDRNRGLAPLLIRLLIGFHLIYSVQVPVLNPDAMQGVIGFFTSQHIPAPEISARLAAYAEFICGILFILGAFTRPAALVMIIVFVVAIITVHIPDTYPNTFPALVMLIGSVSLLFSGAGSVSVDRLISKKSRYA